MIDSNEKLEIVLEYLGDTVDLGDTYKNELRKAISYLHKSIPTDKLGIYNRTQEIVGIGEDLSFIIMYIKNKRNKIEFKMKEEKDPMFTMLVRQNRPSTQAIESEIRYNKETVRKAEETITELNNVLEYLSFVQNSVDKYLWTLRDLLKGE